MENEIWKDVKGFEGLYQVSNLGRIKSLDRIIVDKKGFSRKIKGAIRKQTITNGGYKEVILYSGDNQKTALVHRLVGEAFIPNVSNLPQINHKDENKGNNTVDNLEWCTNDYNHNYGTAKYRIAEKNKKKVYQYSLDGKLVKIWDSVTDAQQFYNNTHISDCARGVRKKCVNFKWSYDEL